jgi:Zn-dependent protease/CBS domain-containing protein
MGARGGFRIGTIRGIPILIHWTFLLVLPFLAWGFGRNLESAARVAGVPPGRLPGPPWAWGLLVALALFASVLVHEVAHSLYALSHGGRVRSITLLMIGGISELTDPPRSPAEEAWMAAAGPATSLGIGALALAILGLSRGHGGFEARFALFYLAELNLGLGAFNLLPAFPMDGGRVLRGLLARRRGPARATQIAAGIGKAFAVLFAIWGFVSGNLMLGLVAFFVWVGAEAEQQAVLARALVGELRVAEVMTRQPGAVAPGDSVYDVAERMLRDRRLSFPVAAEGHVLGEITSAAVERVPFDRRRDTPASAAAVPAVAVAPGDRVSDALRLLARGGEGGLVVVEDDRLVGTLSPQEVARALRLEELAASQHHRAGPGDGESGGRWPAAP